MIKNDFGDIFAKRETKVLGLEGGPTGAKNHILLIGGGFGVTFEKI